MQTFLRVLVFAAVAMQPVWAAGSADAAAPSDKSIQELLAVMQTRNLLRAEHGQINALMHRAMQQALNGKQVTPAQQKIIDDWSSKTVAVVQQQLNWKTMEPTFVGIYQKSFTQKEVDGMLAFYKSEAGRAVIKKMPVVMHYAMQDMMGRMQQMMPKLQKIQQEEVAKLKALDDKDSAASSGKS